METPKEYTIIVRNISFVFFDDQIHRDYPNYFTNYFEGPFKESQDGVRVMRLNRDPYLFTFIHLYLSGYDVLPLPKGNIPHYLSEESRLKNLLLDAHFYGLDTLAKELEVLVRPTKCGGKSEEVQVAKETWKVFKQRPGNNTWAYLMSLYDWDAFEYYHKGAKTTSDYQVIPADVSGISDGLGNIYTYSNYDHANRETVTFAIGKVKET